MSNKIKTRTITIIAFLALIALCLGLAFGMLPTVRADAATYTPSSFFWEMTGGELGVYSPTKEDAEAEDSFGYVSLLFGGGERREGSVEYHKNLALKWYLPYNEDVKDGDAEDSYTTDRAGEKKYFSMTFAFPEVNFETFSITFSGTEENVTKDGKSVNELIFKKEGTSLYAYLKDSALQEEYKDKKDEQDYVPAEADKLLIEDPTADITLAITEDETCGAGEFALTLNGLSLGTEHTRLTNIGGYYMEYRTSGTENVPLTFKAVMPEKAESETKYAAQKVLMKELNCQTLKVTKGNAAKENDATKVEEDGTVLYENGSVEDNAAPALVLNQKVYAFRLGSLFSLDYQVMDVCDSSLTVNRYYYMARQDEEGNWTLPNLTETQNTETGYSTLSTNDYFLPTQETASEVQYVSIRFTVDDGRDGSSNRLFYYLNWYADMDADVVETLSDGESSFDYIRVDRERKAPYYTIITAENGENAKAADYDDVVGDYQTQLTEAAAKASVGDGAYFYLPSLRSLIKSDYADYRDLRFSIYYRKPNTAEGSTASSETSLRYNNLRFEIDEIGLYEFRIMAADASGNTMQMYVDEGDGQSRLTAVSSSNIWDIEEIPSFRINVKYKGAVIEDMDDQPLGYRGTSYSVSNFEIIAYGNSTKSYSLYYLDEAKVKEKSLTMPTYGELVEDTEKYLTGEGYKDCFVEINEYNSDITEDDEEAWNRTDNAYHWAPSDTPGSFTPQRSGYYVVKLTLKDGHFANTEKTAYQAIDIRNPVDVTPARIDWLKNNVTSVVLFAISAVLAVAIVVLFVVKPSEKNVEEVDLDKLKGKKKEQKPEKKDEKK